MPFKILASSGFSRHLEAILSRGTVSLVWNAAIPTCSYMFENSVTSGVKSFIFSANNLADASSAN